MKDFISLENVREYLNSATDISRANIFVLSAGFIRIIRESVAPKLQCKLWLNFRQDGVNDQISALLVAVIREISFGSKHSISKLKYYSIWKGNFCYRQKLKESANCRTFLSQFSNRNWIFYWFCGRNSCEQLMHSVNFNRHTLPVHLRFLRFILLLRLFRICMDTPIFMPTDYLRYTWNKQKNGFKIEIPHFTAIHFSFVEKLPSAIFRICLICPNFINSFNKSKIRNVLAKHLPFINKGHHYWTTIEWSIHFVSLFCIDIGGFPFREEEENSIEMTLSIGNISKWWNLPPRES